MHLKDKGERDMDLKSSGSRCRVSPYWKKRKKSLWWWNLQFGFSAVVASGVGLPKQDKRCTGAPRFLDFFSTAPQNDENPSKWRIWR
jgi:hypothetical protein